MITEDDLSLVLHELADEAPPRCATFDPRPRADRRRRITAVAGAAALVAATVLAVALTPSLTSGDAPPATRPAAPSTTTAAPSARESSEVAPPESTRSPARTRRLLTHIAQESARINGESHPTAWAVRTTYAGLNQHFPSFFPGTPAPDRRTHRTPAPATPVWVVWMRGDFGGGYYAMADLVDDRTMKDLAATFEVDTGYGLSADQLRPLGTVLRLL